MKRPPTEELAQAERLVAKTWQDYQLAMSKGRGYTWALKQHFRAVAAVLSLWKHRHRIPPT